MKTLPLLFVCLIHSAWGASSHPPTAGKPAVAEDEANSSPSPGEERFVAGEALVIQIPLDPTSFLNGGYGIDEAGFVNLPVIGRLYVQDKKASDVGQYLGSKLSEYLKDTHLTLTPAIRLNLLGHWQKPGMLYVDPDASLWDAVYQTGGPAGEKNLRKMTVMRGEQDLLIPILNEYSKGTTLRRAGVRSGDIFVIPVPDEKGAWYWFRETLGVTAQITGVIASVFTVYITYELLDRGLIGEARR